MPQLAAATDFLQVPTDGTGKKTAFLLSNVGGGQLYIPASVLTDSAGNTIDSATSAPLAGTERGLVSRSIVQGANQPVTTGTITTATSTVGGSSDLTFANHVTVAIYGPTYAGVNATFEVSPDGTNWFPIAGVREDSGILESTTGVLPANTIRSWSFSLYGFIRFRVRATAWTSGTANVSILPGTLPIEPSVAATVQSPPRTSFVLANAAIGVTTVSTEALMTLAQVQRNYAPVASGTSFALTAGKTYRIQAIALEMNGGTVSWGQIFVRYNPTGAATVTSPVVAGLGVGIAAINAGGSASISFPDGIDLPAGSTPGQIAISHVSNATTLNIRVVVTGYEY